MAVIYINIDGSYFEKVFSRKEITCVVYPGCVVVAYNDGNLFEMCFCETKQFDMAVAVVYNDGGFFEKKRFL